MRPLLAIRAAQHADGGRKPLLDPFRRAPSPSGPASPLSRREKSGRAGGIKGGTGKSLGRSLAAMSPFPLVRRGFGWWSCGDSNPGPSHCEGVPDPIGHRSMLCISCTLTTTVPRCQPRGAPGGHANRSLAGEPGHRRGSTFEPCVPLKAALPPRRAVSDRHVHDLRRRPTSRCLFVSLIQPVPTRPHRFRRSPTDSRHTTRAADAAPRYLTGVATAVLTPSNTRVCLPKIDAGGRCAPHRQLDAPRQWLVRPLCR